MFKDYIKTLKKQFYIKRRKVNSYHEIKYSFSEIDFFRFSEMLHVDFAENYKNDKRDVYFGYQYFRIFTAC